MWNCFESDKAGLRATGMGTGECERLDAKVSSIMREELERGSLVSSAGNKGTALLMKIP
jgi:hypothetical protein